jgi:hypothetical protein
VGTIPARASRWHRCDCRPHRARKQRYTLANPCKQPASIIFFDNLIVENDDSYVWLREHFVTRMCAIVVPIEPPGRLDRSAYKLGQFFVTRKKQQSRREVYHACSS